MARGLAAITGAVGITHLRKRVMLCRSATGNADRRAGRSDTAATHGGRRPECATAPEPSGRDMRNLETVAVPETMTIRTPAGQKLTAIYDRSRGRWRVEPGGYERFDLRDALAQATGASRDAAWIGSIIARVTRIRRVRLHCQRG